MMDESTAMSAATRSAVQQAADMLRGAQRVLVMTGAGMSADSGLPTYRGIGGLYDGDETEDGVAIEEALSGPVFRRNPELTWKYIAQIESACRGASPNDGHTVLTRLQQRHERFCVLTQNVDGFHTAAGSRDVIQMHGDIHRLYCTGCYRPMTVEDFSQLPPLPPACEQCGGIVRPDVVLFGEMLPDRALLQYEAIRTEGFDAIVAIGTTAVFPYIYEPFKAAAAAGLPSIEINPQETIVSSLCMSKVRLPAARALLEIEAQLDS